VAWLQLDEHLLQHFPKFLLGVADLLIQVFRHAVLHDGRESVGAEILLVVHIGYGTHTWAEDELHVVREVELKEQTVISYLIYIPMVWDFTCTDPLVRCMTTAHVVRNQECKCGIREI